MVKRRNRKLETVIDTTLSTADRGVQYYRTPLSNSVGYPDGFASSIWPMGAGKRLNPPASGTVADTGFDWHNTGSSEGYDFGELNKLNYDSLIELYGPVENSCGNSPSGSYLDASTPIPSDLNSPQPPYTASGITISDEQDPNCPGLTYQVAIHSASRCDNKWGKVYEGAYFDTGSHRILPESTCGHYEFSLSGSDLPLIGGQYSFDGYWGTRVSLWPVSGSFSGTNQYSSSNSMFVGIDNGTKYGQGKQTPACYTVEFGFSLSSNAIGWAQYDGYSVQVSGTNTDFGIGWIKQPPFVSPAGILDVLNQRWRIKRTYNPPPISGALCPWEILFQVSQGGGCWNTFYSSSLDSLSEFNPDMSLNDLTQMLSQSYYLCVDWAGHCDHAPANYVSLGTSSISSGSLTVMSHSGGRSEYSQNPTASVSWLYPAGFITNDQPKGGIVAPYGDGQNADAGYKGNSYKDYGLLYETPYWRGEWSPVLEEAGAWDPRFGGGVGTRWPFYNSYEDYAVDIRCMAKDYTILPEFKISNLIEYYAEHGFRWAGPDQPTDFLSLDGGDITSSAEQSGKRGLNINFFKEYSNSDFMSDFDLLVYQHVEQPAANALPPIAQPASMSMTCNVIKKLLPYEGFYPMTRTTQLATLFDKALDYKIGTDYNLQLYHYDNTRGCWSEGLSSADYYLHPEWNGIRKQGMLTPFFAPGILYNSLKSGLGVAWTVVTGSSLLDTYFMFNTAKVTGSDCAIGSPIVSQSQKPGNCPEEFLNTVVYNDPAYARKIPFESLYTLEGIPTLNPVASLPDDGAFHINYPETLMGYFTGSGVCTASADIITQNQNFRLLAKNTNTNQQQLYLMAMNNFLASSVSIFLSQGERNTVVTDLTRGNLTSFPSMTVKEISDGLNNAGFVENRTYFMDVELQASPWDASVLMVAAHDNGLTPSSFYKNDYAARNINPVYFDVLFTASFGCPPASSPTADDGNPNPQKAYELYNISSEETSQHLPLGGYIYNLELHLTEDILVPLHANGKVIGIGLPLPKAHIIT